MSRYLTLLFVLFVLWCGGAGFGHPPQSLIVSRGEERIPLFGKYGLASQLGSVEYSRPRRFRAMLDHWIGVVRALWPECPAQITADGQAVRIDHATAVCPSTLK
jgi:hypothetical protein